MTAAVAERAAPGTHDADADAFAAFVAGHRSELHRHCQRILRSPERAEDAVQEALLRGWRARASFVGQAPLHAWLRRIATNACLDELRRARPVLSFDADAHDVPDPDGATDAGPEAREALERAMLDVMAILPPRQRAVLVLRGVLDYRAEETARLLGTTVPAVNSALQRARATVRAAPAGTGRPDPATGPVLRAYVDALVAHDVSRVVAMARRDALAA